MNLCLYRWFSYDGRRGSSLKIFKATKRVEFFSTLFLCLKDTTIKKEFLSYLITDPKYYTNNPKKFTKKLSKALKNKIVNIVCFRDKSSHNQKKLAKIFIELCKKHNIKNILINSDYKLASKLGASGVHLNSTQFDKIKIAKTKNLFVIISCHSFKEIKKAQKLGANAVTYSPIFFTPKKSKPKGVKKLVLATKLFDIDIIALGGIVSKKEINAIKPTKAKGFASIRYFV